MEIKEWRRLAVQSVVFLALVLLSCVGFSLGAENPVESGVYAEGKKEIESRNMLSRQEKMESPTMATQAMVEERSDTYIKISKEHIFSPSKVYLQNKYMDFQVVLTFEGIAAGSIRDDDIVQNRGIYVSSGQASGKNTFLKGMEIQDKNKADASKNTVQIRLLLKKAYEPILFESEEAYYISMLEARKAHEKIVVIDAGHGGIDEGTSSVNRKHYEKDYVLYIQEKLSKLLDKTDIAVYYTRTKDEDISKKSRVQLANALQADLFVSIHCNALEGGRNTYGIETLYSKRKPSYGKWKNKELAELMLERVTESTGRKKRAAIRREELYLMRHAKVPTTIIEVGYMTNQDDMNYMKKEIGQQKIAEGIYQGILDALNNR